VPSPALAGAGAEASVSSVAGAFSSLTGLLMSAPTTVSSSSSSSCVSRLAGVWGTSLWAAGSAIAVAGPAPFSRLVLLAASSIRALHRRHLMGTSQLPLLRGPERLSVIVRRTWAASPGPL
jgi:hypothetical protein